MPEDDIDLPSTLERSPKKIQHTYEQTLGSAENTYDNEASAHRVAWGAVKHIAEKQGDHWELKDEPGPSDSRSKQSHKDKIRGKGETYRGIDVEGNTRAELVERAKKAGVKGYSSMKKADLAKALARKQG